METAFTNGDNTSGKQVTQPQEMEVAEMKFQEIKIPVPWGHIAAKWWGPTDKQPVLAIHGWQDNAGSFDELAPLIAKNGIPVLCIDLPGHGLSSAFPLGMYYYIFWDGLQIVRRIKAHFNWLKLKLLGHSLGGIISFMFASAYPDEVDCIMCLDIASPAVRDPIELIDNMGRTVSQFLKYEALPKEMQPSYDYNEMVETAYSGYAGSCSRKAVEILLRRGMKPAGGNKFVFTRDIRLKAVGLGMIDIQSSMAMARKITCRVLNIRGDPGMKLTKPEYYDMILDELEKTATVERHVVKGMHHLHLDNASEVVPYVVDFLQDGE